MFDNAKVRQLRRAAVPEAGNRVAIAIRLTGKTQGEVASDLEMPQSQLSDIARGRFPDPKLSTVRKLTNYFGGGVRIEDLFPERAA